MAYQRRSCFCSRFTACVVFVLIALLLRPLMASETRSSEASNKVHFGLLDSCPGSRQGPTQRLEQLRQKFRADFGSSLSAHDSAELAILKETFRDQAKETLCEMIVIEALSPYGWFGDSSRTEAPSRMMELAASFGYEDFTQKMRSLVKEQKIALREDFEGAMAVGLSLTAEKMREVQNQILNAKTPEKASQLRQEVETAFRDYLPFPNHPLLREHYDFVLKHAFQEGASHPTKEDLPDRVSRAIKRTQSHLSGVLESARASLEIEASVYSGMQSKSQRGDQGGYQSEEYRKTLGLLGGFTGDGKTSTETEALQRLQRRYGSQKTMDSSVARGIADFGMAFAPPGIGDLYSIGSELDQFGELISQCHPTTPKGLRSGMCDTLQAITSKGAVDWEGDFFGAVTDPTGCRWKTSAQAGAVVLSGIPIANRGLKVLRARGAIKALAGGGVARGASARVGSEVAQSGIVGRGAQVAGVAGHQSHTIRRAERLKQRVFQNNSEIRKIKTQLSSLAKRKGDLEFSLKVHGKSQKTADELAHVQVRMSELKAEIERRNHVLQKHMVQHSRSALREAAQSPPFKNVHLQEHFVPPECFKPSDSCDRRIAELAKLRKNKEISYFFPENLRMETLLDPNRRTLVREVPVAATSATTTYFEIGSGGSKLRFAIVLCQDPRSCAHSGFGEIEAIFPICGKGTKVLVKETLIEGAPCQ